MDFENETLKISAESITLKKETTKASLFPMQYKAKITAILASPILIPGTAGIKGGTSDSTYDKSNAAANAKEERVIFFDTVTLLTIG